RTPTSSTSTLSLHDALPICSDDPGRALGVSVQGLDELVACHAGLQRIGLEVGGNQGEGVVMRRARGRAGAEIMRQAHQALAADRSEEHTSELQSLAYLVCRL